MRSVWMVLVGGLALGALALGGCNLEQDIDVVLPAEPARLVVECYLENGQVPEMTVTETAPYLSNPTPTLLTDVTVTLTGPDGRTEQLRFQPGQNATTKKLYTHRGQRALRINPGDTWQLRVTDTQGRTVVGTATRPSTVPLDTVEYEFNDQRKAIVRTRFRDPAGKGDAYRFQVHEFRLSDNPDVQYIAEDDFLDGQVFTLGTSYEHNPGDTLFVTVYHLDPPYRDFLRSLRAAQSANGNPFATPAALQSTVQGGVGVFAILNYQRRRLILPR